MQIPNADLVWFAARFFRWLFILIWNPEYTEIIIFISSSEIKSIGFLIDVK